MVTSLVVPSPSGQQFVISGSGYTAVVTESGAALRTLNFDGLALVDGFEEDELSLDGRGQLLIPWPNLLRDGTYEFDGRRYELALTFPSLRCACHGLVRWAGWTPVEHTDASVTMKHRLMAESGYPWRLDLHTMYSVGVDGLTVTHTATNRATKPAPFGCGAHPYLSAGPGPVDDWVLELPASTVALTDDRLLPVGTTPVAGTPYDFRQPRPVAATEFVHAFTDLARGADGRAVVRLRGRYTVELWVDEAFGWLQLYTADNLSGTARRSLAVEPMTANADAFNTKEDLVVLAPGETFTGSWGIRLA